MERPLGILALKIVATTVYASGYLGGYEACKFLPLVENYLHPNIL
jgi:hypothetical protein